MEYYVEPSFGADTHEAEKQLYLAVVHGAVRAKRKGIILGPEWRRRISRMKFQDNALFALPPDLKLSVEDAVQLWSARDNTA